MMKKLSIILGIILALSAIAGGVYRFDMCKVAKADFKEYVAMNDTMWMENFRRNLQQKIWDLQREFPTTYINRVDYKQLIEELRLLEMKINAYYQRKGK